MTESLFTQLHLHVFTMDCCLLTPDRWRMDNVQNAFWRFYYNNQDGAYLEWNGEIVPLDKEQVYFVPAGVRFNYRAAKPVFQFYVHFDLLGLPGPALGELFDRPICVPGNAALALMAARLAREVQDVRQTLLPMECRVQGTLYEALAAYLETVPADRLAHYSQRAASLEPVRPAICYIEQHIADDLSNQTLARLCCLSADYFSRRFHECAGQTVSRYIQEQRVRLAAQQLLFTDHSLDRIASENGFGNRFYFSRIFTRHTGFSPAAYRKTPRI